MAGTTSTRKRTAADCAIDPKRLRALLDSAIEKLEKQLGGAESDKVNLADVLRLLQLYREMEPSRPRRVTAEWVSKKKSP
jgi:hypothetical protein